MLSDDLVELDINVVDELIKLSHEASDFEFELLFLAGQGTLISAFLLVVVTLGILVRRRRRGISHCALTSGLRILLIGGRVVFLRLSALRLLTHLK